MPSYMDLCDPVLHRRRKAMEMPKRDFVIMVFVSSYAGEPQWFYSTTKKMTRPEQQTGS